MDEKEIFDVLYEIADTVIEIKIVPSQEEIEEESYRKECFDVSITHVNEFFNEFDKRLLMCKSEIDIIFLKETTLNFLIFSLKKLLVNYDCPDENIEYLANHFRDQILSLKRSIYKEDYKEK